MEILNVQEHALADAEYLHLYTDYSSAQEHFRQLMTELPAKEQEIIENYLLTAVALHQRLMELAINYGKALGR